jgi:tetratricopeptide (TPR) repeat protein
MDRSGQITELLQQGIAAARDKRKQEAYQLLLQVTELDERNEQAWLWLSGVVDSFEDRRVCIENVLAINPENVYALAGMRWLDEHAPQEQAPPPAAAQAPPPADAQVQAPPTTPQERCPSCLSPVSLSDKACPDCGELLVVACPTCGEYADVGDLSCPACGVILGDCQEGVGYYLGLTDAYLQAGKPDLAREMTPFAGRAAAGNVEALLAVANLYVQVDHADGAVEAYRGVIEADPGNALAHVRLGALAHARGESELARAECEQAAGLVGDDATALFELARLHLDEYGPTEQARTWLSQAVRLDRKHASAFLLLGDVRHGQGERKEAVRHYKRAVKLAPADSDVAREAKQRLETPPADG